MCKVDVKYRNPRNLVRWKKGHEKIISKYIKEYMNILEIKGSEVQTTRGIELDAYRRVLSQYVEMEGVSDLETKANILFRMGFRRLKRYKIQNLQYFKLALGVELKNHLSAPVEEYWFILPFHSSSLQLCGFTSIDLFGEQLIFQTWKQVYQNCEFDKVLNQNRARFLKLKELLLSKFVPVVVYSQGRNIEEAYKKALRPFEFFRNAFNFRSLYNVYKIHTQGNPRDSVKHLQSPIDMVFCHDGTYLDAYYDNRPNLDVPINKVSEEDIKRTIDFVRYLDEKDEKNSVARMLITTIDKYTEAFDSDKWSYTFLLLWQILENYSSVGNRTGIRRVKNLLDDDKLREDLLDLFVHTRNDFVHRGLFPQEAGFREVYLLKLIVDKAILKLFKIIDEYPSRNSLGYYFEYRSKGHRELAERKMVIEVLEP